MSQRAFLADERLKRIIRAMRSAGGRRYFGSRGWLTLAGRNNDRARELKDAFGRSQNPARLGMFLKGVEGTKLDDMTLVAVYSKHRKTFMYAVRKEADAVFEAAIQRAAGAARKAHDETFAAEIKAAREVVASAAPVEVQAAVTDHGRTHNGAPVIQQPQINPRTAELPAGHPLAGITRGAGPALVDHRSPPNEDYSSRRAFQLLERGDTTTPLDADRRTNRSWSPFD